jgi:hypothetical protein
LALKPPLYEQVQERSGDNANNHIFIFSRMNENRKEVQGFKVSRERCAPAMPSCPFAASYSLQQQYGHFGCGQK